MLFCDACDKGYHMNCHKPPVMEKPGGKWVCSECIQELGLDENSLADMQHEDDNKEVGVANNVGQYIHGTQMNHIN